VHEYNLIRGTVSRNINELVGRSRIAYLPTQPSAVRIESGSVIFLYINSLLSYLQTRSPTPSS